MFQKRLKDDKAIFLNEFVYPMFQGYDSVAMDVDVELCGTDQIFNALMGRDLVRQYNQKEKFVVAVNLMENPKTGALMSKTNGTGVFLNASAKDMFGQIMQQPDEMIRVILINNTRIPLSRIDKLAIEENPMEAKLFTAFEVTKIFHGEEEATMAKDSFINTFRKRSFPADAPIVAIPEKGCTLIDVIARCMPEISKGQIRRLIAQSAVSINSDKHTDPLETILCQDSEELELQVGKRGFYRIKK